MNRPAMASADFRRGGQLFPSGMVFKVSGELSVVSEDVNREASVVGRELSNDRASVVA